MYLRTSIMRERFLGMKSCFRLSLAPWGAKAAKFHESLYTNERRSKGLVIILPGIEGPSSINDEIARGLAVAGISYAIQIVDWRSSKQWSPWHLTKLKFNQQQAARIAARIVDYRRDYGDNPVHLIGHSGGGGIAMLTLEQLPVEGYVDSVVLLAAAISPEASCMESANRSKTGVWNFCSYGDLPTLGLGTLVFGTIDRRHGFAAGAVGLKPPKEITLSEPAMVKNIFFQWKMIKSWNFGGHFGATNAAFVAEFVAPILKKVSDTFLGDRVI